MNGVHDMGGMDGFGTVKPEANEAVFHHAWESRVYAMVKALGVARLWSIDEGRYSIEQLPPAKYLASPYYRRWFLGFEQTLLRRGLIGEDEVAAGRALRAGRTIRVLDTVTAAGPQTRSNYLRPAPAPAVFKIGDKVRMKNIHPETHTRLPRYVRGKLGVIDAVRGCQVLPDSAAIGAGENPGWLYTVLFSARELWGVDADEKHSISVDAWEVYLERA